MVKSIGCDDGPREKHPEMPIVTRRQAAVARVGNVVADNVAASKTRGISDLTSAGLREIVVRDEGDAGGWEVGGEELDGGIAKQNRTHSAFTQARRAAGARQRHDNLGPELRVYGWVHGAGWGYTDGVVIVRRQNVVLLGTRT